MADKNAENVGEKPSVQYQMEIIQAAARVLMDAALDAIQADPHQWSSRPCQTCQAVSAIAGRPFGCFTKYKIG